MSYNENNFNGQIPPNSGDDKTQEINMDKNIYSDSQYADSYSSDNNVYSNSGTNQNVSSADDYSTYSSIPNSVNNYSENSNSSQYSQGSYNPYTTQNFNNTQSYNDNFAGDSGYSETASVPVVQSQSYNYGASVPYTATQYSKTAAQPRKQEKKKSKGFVASLIIIGLLASAGLGFGGGMIANTLSNNGIIQSGDGLTIQKVVNTVNPSENDGGEMTTADIVKNTENSVVEITTETVQTGSLTQQYITSGAGSGVIISENGYIVTNNHVINGAEKIVVTLHDGTTYDAKLIGTDSEIDIALLKVEANGLSAAVIGDSSKLSVGEKTVVIGNPLGQLGGTVTEGIISALNRDLVIDGVTKNLLQTSAAINPGNSGGGMFNSRGELIGIVVAKTVDEEVEGLGFAIPINDVSNVIGDLKKYGYVRGRAEMGISVVDVSTPQSAMMYGVNSTGVYVSAVNTSGAEKAGFQIGDKITSIEDKTVSAKSDIEAVIKSHKVGDIITVIVDRNGESKTLKATLTEDLPDEASNDNKADNNNNGRENGGNGNFGGNNDGNDDDIRQRIEDYLRNYF